MAVVSKIENQGDHAGGGSPSESTDLIDECLGCPSAMEKGVILWMEHLVMDHPVPGQWPSDRAAQLQGVEKLKPYTMVTGSKKKRHNGKPPRPLNSYMLFGQYIRRNVLRVFSRAMNQEVSKTIGELWNRLPPHIRAEYATEADRLGKLHALEYPGYKYQPKRRVLEPSSIGEPAKPAQSTVQDHGQSQDQEESVVPADCSIKYLSCPSTTTMTATFARSSCCCDQASSNITWTPSSTCSLTTASSYCKPITYPILTHPDSAYNSDETSSSASPTVIVDNDGVVFSQSLLCQSADQTVVENKCDDSGLSRRRFYSATGCNTPASRRRVHDEVVGPKKHGTKFFRIDDCAPVTLLTDGEFDPLTDFDGIKVDGETGANLNNLFDSINIDDMYCSEQCRLEENVAFDHYIAPQLID